MLISFVRSMILYILLIAAIRLMGKRQLGEMEPSEFVVSMLLADLAATPIQDLEIPMAFGVIPILTVMVLEILLSILSYHFVDIRRILCGKPVLLIEDGKICAENLKKTRLTPDELVEQLREKDIFDLSVIQYAILETDGTISAMVDSSCMPPAARDLKIRTAQHGLPVILVSSGQVVRHGLLAHGRSQAWILQELQKKNCRLEEVLLFTEDSEGNLYLAVRDNQKTQG